MAMKPKLHLFTAPLQKATRYRYPYFSYGKAAIRRNPGNRLLWPACCFSRRPAKNLVVQVYYDCIDFVCAKGKGCKK